MRDRDDKYKDDDRPRRKGRRRRDDDEDDSPRRGIAHCRTYYHSRCRGLTQVDGVDYARLCDPYWVWTAAYCCTCDKDVPLNTVEWDDTGEAIPKYRWRMRSRRPGFLAAWQVGLGALIGAIVCGGIALVPFLPVKLDGKETLLSSVAAVVGAVFFHFAGASVLKHIYRIDYRQME